MEENSRLEQQTQKAGCFNSRHNYYRKTRCTSMAQEEQSALPAGVININEDDDDDDAYMGESKEIAKEMDELRVAQHWINQAGWDTAGEVHTISKNSGAMVDLRRDWGAVKTILTEGVGDETEGDIKEDDKDNAAHKYNLDDLDPTQRVFADRMLTWAAEVATIYETVKALVWSLLLD